MFDVSEQRDADQSAKADGANGRAGVQYRYLCERCGGTGRQVPGLYVAAIGTYASDGGTCDDCGGTGYLSPSNRGCTPQPPNTPASRTIPTHCWPALFITLILLSGCRTSSGPEAPAAARAVLPPLQQAATSVASAREKADKLPTSELKGGIVADLTTAGGAIGTATVQSEAAIKAADRDAKAYRELRESVSIVRKLWLWAATAAGVGVLLACAGIFLAAYIPFARLVRAAGLGLIASGIILFGFGLAAHAVEAIAVIAVKWFGIIGGAAGAIVVIVALIDWLPDHEFDLWKRLRKDA